MQPLPLPAPYGGIDQQIAAIALESPFAEVLHNYNVTQTGVELRNGDTIYTYNTPATGASTPLQQFVYGDANIFYTNFTAGGNTVFVNGDTGVVAYTTAAVTGAILYYQLYFNNYLFFFNPGLGGGYTYNGSAWAISGYTGSGFAPVGGTSFKRRAYIIQSGEAAYWYSPIDAITGALTKVDLSSITEQKSSLITITPITVADDISAVTFLAFVFGNGEVIFYSGSYPDSSDWGEVGRGKVGPALDYNAVVRYQGDALVLCDSGVVSLRALFLKGSEEAASLTVNNRIQKSWTAIVQAIRTAESTPVGAIEFIKAVYDPKTNRIIISFPYRLNSDGSVTAGSYYFVYNTIFQSWVTHSSYGGTYTATNEAVKDIARYNNRILFLMANGTAGVIYQKEGAAGFTDEKNNNNGEIGYPFECRWAPLANGRAYVQKVEGLDVILQTDMQSVTEYQFIGDFGVATTNAQKVTVPDTNIQKPFINVGTAASYIQPKCSGTTTSGKTTGLKIYGINVWLDQGESPR